MNAWEICQQFCFFFIFDIKILTGRSVECNLLSRETSKNFVGKLKPIFYRLAVTQVWLYLPDEFSCKKEGGTLKCLICTLLQHYKRRTEY